MGPVTFHSTWSVVRPAGFVVLSILGVVFTTGLTYFFSLSSSEPSATGSVPMAASSSLTTVAASRGFCCVVGYRLMTKAVLRRSFSLGHAVRICVADVMPGPNSTVGK